MRLLDTNKHVLTVTHPQDKLEEGLEAHQQALAIVEGGSLPDNPQLTEMRTELTAIGGLLRRRVRVACERTPLW